MHFFITRENNRSVEKDVEKLELLLMLVEILNGVQTLYGKQFGSSLVINIKHMYDPILFCGVYPKKWTGIQTENCI